MSIPQRTKVGLISLVLLLVSAALVVWPLSDPTTHVAVQGACVRIGLIMAAIWLALPQLSVLPGWLVALVTLSAVIIAFRPKYAIIAVPLVIAFLVLRPRGPRPAPPRA